MISVNKKIILFHVITILNVFPQNTLQQQIECANQLFNQEKYFDAITEFKRLQFFDKENLIKPVPNLMMRLNILYLLK